MPLRNQAAVDSGVRLMAFPLYCKAVVLALCDRAYILLLTSIRMNLHSPTWILEWKHLNLIQVFRRRGIGQATRVFLVDGCCMHERTDASAVSTRGFGKGSFVRVYLSGSQLRWREILKDEWKN